METTTELLTINGVVLNTLAKNVESLLGRLRRAAFRTGNVTVPGGHGALWTPNKKYDVNIISLPMWVRGCDDDGNVPPDRRAEFFSNIDQLTQLFSGPDLLDIRHTLADGSVRQCFGEVLDIIDIDSSGVSGDNPRGRFTAAVTLPYPFWQDVNSITENFAVGVGLTHNLSLVSFEGATAPMEELIFTITGPCNNPSIDTGVTTFEYQDVLAAGKILTVDSGQWTLAGTGFVPTESAFTHTGDSRWAVVVPPQSGAASITFANTGGSSAATALSVQGRRKYLVG